MMARKPNLHFGGMMDQARALLAANPTIAPQIAQFWKVQEQMLRDTETYAQGWFARRHEAIRSAREAVRRANGPSGIDPAQSLQRGLEWQRGSWQRTAEDLQEWAALCARCAGHLADAEIEAGKDSAQHLAKTMAASTGATHHATPV